ncbi:MAG: hypothetical protein M1402_02805 [Candidatus Thermoplasmatota archaeon]|nr:hypothetical protein [Candidatus Thermoplasmatota archaeon]
MQSSSGLPSSKRSDVESDNIRRFSIYSFYVIFGMILLVVPLIFYLYWNILYDDWADVGMYSFVAPTMVFGILIIALGNVKRSMEKPRQ